MYDSCGRSCHIRGSNLSFFLLSRVPRETKDLQWVEAFLPGIYFYEVFVYFCATQKQRIQNCQQLSITASEVLSNISQYTLKPEHLTTLSRTPTRNKKMITSPANMKLLYYIVLPVGTMNPFCTSNALLPILTPKNNPRRHGNNSAHQLKFFILTGPIAFFLLFCCMVIFHQDVNLTF